MAIDTMMYAVQIPAGEYTAGQQIAAKVIRGPSVVRDGYGKAIMKKMFTIASGPTGSLITGHITVKNQNWIDSMASLVSTASGNAGLVSMSASSPASQRCGDIELQPNTSFDVVWTCDDAKTITGSYDVFVLIDIEYPSVTAVQNPKEESGAPVTIMRADTITTTADGGSGSMVWTSINVDIFKAGYRYLLASVGSRVASDVSNVSLGFLAISGAAGQNGLVRIVPILPGNLGAIRADIEYSTPLVKGPMNIEYACMATTAQTGTITAEFDFIRR